MGGHGGLNILPQKRWNVYNYENREKVRRDEEEAAREEQLKREQARKRDAEFRLERLRTARGLAPSVPPPPESEPKPSSDPGHINLFEGIKIFDPIQAPQKEGPAAKKKKKEEGGPRPTVVVGPEDEKYRLGYGLAGKGVQLPWYVRKPNDDSVVKEESGDGDRRENKGEKKRKTMEELREERLQRERKEKDRESALRYEKLQSHRDVSGSRRRFSR
ncbi:CBF1-interacting co-repressor CIR, N-terminal domain [Spatholobus suberectus]|nr:CBF1-interacting co-repressor CIR, N-terminal domain [Spatholobus suberectus]